MDTVKVIEVVETTNARRGKGIEGDPIRIITQYWDKETGELLAEVDPFSKVEQLRNAILWALGQAGDFPAKKEGQGNYYWRAELRERAGL